MVKCSGGSSVSTSNIIVAVGVAVVAVAFLNQEYRQSHRSDQISSALLSSTALSTLLGPLVSALRPQTTGLCFAFVGYRVSSAKYGKHT